MSASSCMGVDRPVDHSRPAIRSASRSHVGLVRSINEDRLFDDAGCGVWAVVDGMGGHSGGDLAAQQVINSLKQRCAEPGAITPAAVRDALFAANTAIHARNQRLRLDAGATAVAATYADGQLEIAWAGDSRAYAVRGGRAEQLTHDHSLVQKLVDAGLLAPDQAERHPQANIVTRALGVDAELALDTRTAPARASRFLLCSDGLSRSLRKDDLVKDLPLPALADQLMASALARDGSDNVSLVLIEID